MIVPAKKIPTQYLLTEEARPLFPPEITLEVQGVTLEEIKPVEKKTILRPLITEKQVEMKKAIAKRTKLVKAAAGVYTVQLGAFSHRKNALALAGELKGKDFPANVKSSGRWYKVFSGSFKELAGARAYLNKITAAGYEGIVRSYDPYGRID